MSRLNSKAAERACDAAGLAGVIVCAVLVVRAPSAGIADALYYIDMATQMARGLGPTSFYVHLGMPAVPGNPGFWPVLLPALMSVPIRLGARPEVAASIVNGGALLLLGLIARGIARRVLPRAWVAPAVLLAVSQSSCVQFYFTALSEPLFTVFTCAALLLLIDLTSDRAPVLGRVGALGLLIGAAFATRFAGLYLAAYALLVGVITARSRRWAFRPTIGAAALGTFAFLVVAIPAVLPNIRDYASPFGMPRVKSPSMLAGAKVLGGELAVSLLQVMAAAAIGAILVFVIAPLVARRLQVPQDEAPPSREDAKRTFAVLIGWVIVYLPLFFISLLTHVQSERINPRYLCPLLPALSLALTIAISLWAGSLPRGAAVARALVALAGAVAVFTMGSVRRERGSAAAAASDPAVTRWALARARPGAVFIGDELMGLRHRTGAVIIQDSYPEMPPLSPEAVMRFLARDGAAIDTVHVVLRRGETMCPERAAEYAGALTGAGYHSGPFQALEPGLTVFSATRDPREDGGAAARR